MSVRYTIFFLRISAFNLTTSLHRKEPLSHFSFSVPGIICMMPWDILVTIDGYWDYKFRNQSLDDMEEEELNNSTDPELTKYVLT